MRRKRVIENMSRDERIAQMKEGDIVFTTLFGKCTVDYVDPKIMKTNPGLYVRDEDNAPHFINARDIILEE